MKATAKGAFSDPLVLRLSEIQRHQLTQVGGKALNLAILIQGGLPVPPGFCITTVAFQQLLDACPKRDVVMGLLKQATANARDQESIVSNQIAASLAETPLPIQVEQSVVAAWRAQGAERAYAVRSSATVEDAASHSFAGQFESCLNIRGRDALLTALKTCWLSLFSARALTYLANSGFSLDKVAMAVVVQEMAPAEAAGVLFTVDPVSGSATRMVIEGAAGCGQRLVSGRVNPECVVLEKRTLRVIRQRATTDEPCLTKALVQRLGKLGKKVEHLFHQPMDLEWAAARGLVFCLQARPATATPVIKSWEDHQIWTNLNTGEVFPDVPTPSSWSMIQIFITPLFRSIFRLFGADVLKGPSAGLVAGRIYFNVNTAVAALKPFSFALPRVPRIAQALGGGRIEVYQQALMDIPDEALPDLGFRWPKYILSWPGILYVLITHLPRRGEAFLARMKARGKHLARLDFTGMSTPELARTFPKLLHENLADWDLLYLFTRTSVLLVFQKAYRDWLDDPPRSAKAVEG